MYTLLQAVRQHRWHLMQFSSDIDRHLIGNDFVVMIRKLEAGCGRYRATRAHPHRNLGNWCAANLFVHFKLFRFADSARRRILTRRRSRIGCTGRGGIRWIQWLARDGVREISAKCGSMVQRGIEVEANLSLDNFSRAPTNTFYEALSGLNYGEYIFP